MSEKSSWVSRIVAPRSTSSKLLMAAGVIGAAVLFDLTRRYLFTSKSHSHVLKLMSGDTPHETGRAIIYVKLMSETYTGSEHKLSISSFPKEFQRGHMNEFTLYESKITDVHGIEIRGDETIGDEGWKIDKILVKHTDSKVNEAVIPIFSSIKGGSMGTYLVKDVALPQQVPDLQEKRMKDLEENRDEYKLTTKLFATKDSSPTICIPLLEKLPRAEFFKFLRYGITILGKLTKDKADAFFLEHFKGKGDFNSIEEIRDVFHGIGNFFGEPINLDRWRYDEAFALQRLDGVNSCIIRLCTKIPPKLGLSTADKTQIKKRLGMTLEEAIKQKKIFMVDYEILDGLKTRKDYFLPAPIALFFQACDGKMVPVAIQLLQEPGKQNPIFLPSDPEYTWVLAKMWFNVADANYHEAVAHLGFTHLKIGGMCAAVHRQIHKTHPLFKLLMPHFIYLLPINDQVVPELLAEGAYADKILTSGSEGMRELIDRKNKRWRLDVDGVLPEDLKQRGLDDPSLLPQYYYRDDGLKIYNAISKYVTSYVDLYYDSDDVILQDYELQNWRKEMVAEVQSGNDGNGLGILGVPGENGKFTTKEQVCTTLTSIIFTSSVQHAAVNFRQFEEYAFPPNFPGSLRGPILSSKEEVLEQDLVHILPDRQVTYDTMAIMDVLSTKSTNKLGDFEVEYVTDPKALKIVQQFQKDLAEIQKDFGEEMQGRISQYTILSPDNVPNAISI